jgi:hypothetical protein
VWFHSLGIRASRPQLGLAIPRIGHPSVDHLGGWPLVSYEKSETSWPVIEEETEMRRTTLLIWLLVLGAALWLSGRVDSQPAFASATILALLVFSALAVRPSSN